MLGPGAKCVAANTAAAVLLPWAGWAGEGSAEVHFPGTQGRRFEPTHSARGNGLDSYLLEILRQCTPRTLRVWTGLCLLPVDDSETWLQEEHAVNSVGGSPRFLCEPPSPGLGSTSVNAELGLHFPKLLRRLSSAYSPHGSPGPYRCCFTRPAVGPGNWFHKCPG